MRVVLDTNVLVSGYARPIGNEGEVVRMGLDRDFQLYLAPIILDELADVLARKFSFSAEWIAAYLHQLRAAATIVDPPPRADAVPGGHADNRILDCAVAAQADYLVTGDQRHLQPLGEYRGVRIVSAAAFLESYSSR